MAFPFKTGGDFYNCEAQRMRLHNLGANPTETATGLMYFNTGTSNLGKHAVVHDGTNFKALAFVDEIASNTAFTELANRVLTIEKALGEDTANVIDTWEEIQNFLKDIDDNDANLMTMLNDKLSLSRGGVMTGTIKVGAYDAFGQTGGNFYLGTPEYPLLLRSNGTTTINGNTLIHSDNYNSYAPKLDGTGATGTWGISISGNAASATKLADNTAFTAWGQTFFENGKPKDVSGVLHGVTTVSFSSEGAITNLNGLHAIDIMADYLNLGYGYGINGKNTLIGGNNLYLRYGTSQSTGIILNSSGDVGIGTNNPKAKLDVNGILYLTENLVIRASYGKYAGMNFFLDNATTENYHLSARGGDTEQNFRLYYSPDSVTFNALVDVTKGGNVLIGTKTNSGYKLDVAGTGRFTGAVTIKGDLVVEGNIIGKKEVSAGGVGQEGESGAGGGAEVISQTLASGASSYTIANTIKRSDIAVSLYEWNASGNSWDMCLADISVTDSNITVTFGSATTVNHKLVAVG